ncbi:zinc finger protein OZF-like [Hetaerina americana]|uniref:zinc finger protein OZF-like n=1 Tax=Hetaerina americana TaxID=62018 RepID=UPI003A7F1C64
MVDGTSDKVWSSSSTVESAVHSVGTASVEMKNPYSPVHGMNFMAVNNCNEVNIQLPGEIKKEIEDVTIASDAVDSSEVDVQDDMIIVKEEIDTTSGCSVPLKIDTGSSVHEDDSHWLDNEDSSHLDPLEYAEIYMPPEEEVHIKEDCDADIPQMEVRLGGNMLQEQDDYQKQDNAGENASATQPNVCKICNKVFEQKDLLKDHVMHVHHNKVMQFKCDVCLEVFKRKEHLKSHIKLVHALKKKHQCEFCSKNFPYLSKLKIHMSTHTGERPFQCALCLKGFAGKIHLQRHILTHTGEKPHMCEICSKGFALNSSLKRHMLTHTDGKRYKCDVCLKAFASKCFLKDHILKHTDLRPHKCNICSKAFTQRSHLKSHMITHSGEKPHKCVICFKAFALTHHLKSHMKTHTGERPHKCNVCSKAFIQRCHLISHMKTHSAKLS